MKGICQHDNSLGTIRSYVVKINNTITSIEMPAIPIVGKQTLRTQNNVGVMCTLVNGYLLWVHSLPQINCFKYSFPQLKFKTT